MLVNRPRQGGASGIAYTPRTVLLTVVTLVFFAANSLLARAALRQAEIDAASFTAIRLLSGALALALVAALRHRSRQIPIYQEGSSRAAFALFLYAIAFSYAYLSLDAGTGALILFATVQITMLGASIVSGHHPRTREWTGLVLAFGGLVYLVFPGLTAPSPWGALLMAVAGTFWALYSLTARSFSSPIDATTGNFIRAAPLAALVFVIEWTALRPHATLMGVALAALSGAVTSGLGYILWYIVLRVLPTTRAAIVQLTVPVIAAIAGVVLLGEDFTFRLAVSSLTILGGVALALTAKYLDLP